MKRKIVKQGAATLMVSLPSKWARRVHLKKGDEVDIEESDDKLILSTEIKEPHRKIELDVTNLFPLVKRIVANKYVEGADEIVLTSQKPELLKDMPDVVKANLIGFEVVEHSRNKITLKQVSYVSEEEFDIMLRRLFLLVKMMGSDLAAALKSKERNTDLIMKQDENVNRFANYCLRAINKRVRNTTAENSSLYMIVYLAENLADGYKKLAQIRGANDKLIELLKQINEFYSDYIDLFYKFGVPSATAFALKFQRLQNSLKNTRVSNADQALFLGALQEILNYIILMLNNQLNYQVIS